MMLTLDYVTVHHNLSEAVFPFIHFQGCVRFPVFFFCVFKPTVDPLSEILIQVAVILTSEFDSALVMISVALLMFLVRH